MRPVAPYHSTVDIEITVHVNVRDVAGNNVELCDVEVPVKVQRFDEPERRHYPDGSGHPGWRESRIVEYTDHDWKRLYDSVWDALDRSAIYPGEGIDTISHRAYDLAEAKLHNEDLAWEAA